MTYILDTCCLVEAKRHFCPIDVAESFWAKIRMLAATGRIRSIDVVKEEIRRGDDDLSRWVKKHLDNSFFIKAKEGQDVVNRMAEITRWVMASTFYSEKAKRKFMQSTAADIWLVAYAAAYPCDSKIVTLEMAAPAQSGKIKIPDLCNSFGVVCIPFEGMFREMKEKY